MEIGLGSFVEMTPEPSTGLTISPVERVRDLMEEIKLADEVGLDVFSIGEHHREEFVASAPAVILAAAAAVTKNIRLASAVTVLSSDDPVRVFQDFATVDVISNGRAEIVVGRGSFVESYPLFGYDLNDYDALFAEKPGLAAEGSGEHECALEREAQAGVAWGRRLSKAGTKPAAGLDRRGRNAEVFRAGGDARFCR